MVVVTVAQYDKIESLQVRAECRRVVGKICNPATSVEENAPPPVFNEDGITPTPFQVGRFPEGIEENRGSARRLLCKSNSGYKRSHYSGCGTRKQSATRHHCCCFFDAPALDRTGKDGEDLEMVFG